MGLLDGLDPLLVEPGALHVVPVQLVVWIEVDQLDQRRDGPLVDLYRHPVGALGVEADGLARVFPCIFFKLSVRLLHSSQSFTPVL